MTALFLALAIAGLCVACSDSMRSQRAATLRGRRRKLTSHRATETSGAEERPATVDDILRGLQDEQRSDAEKRLQARRAALLRKGGTLEILKLFAVSLVDPLCRGRLDVDDISFGSSHGALGSLGRYVVRFEHSWWRSDRGCRLHSNFGGLAGGGLAGAVCGPNGCF